MRVRVKKLRDNVKLGVSSSGRIYKYVNVSKAITKAEQCCMNGCDNVRYKPNFTTYSKCYPHMRESWKRYGKYKRKCDESR